MAYYNRPVPRAPGLGSYLCGWFVGVLIINLLLLLLGWTIAALIVDAVVVIIVLVVAIAVPTVLLWRKLSGADTPYSRRPPKPCP